MDWYFITMLIGAAIASGSFYIAFLGDSIDGCVEGVGVFLILLILMAGGSLAVIIGLIGWAFS